MSLDSSNDIIHGFDSFCRGIPIIPLAAINAINNHQIKFSTSVLQIVDTPCKTTDVVANTVVEKVFDTNDFSRSSRTLYCFLLISNISHEF